jgi:hypothetical protein
VKDRLWGGFDEFEREFRLQMMMFDLEFTLIEGRMTPPITLQLVDTDIIHMLTAQCTAMDYWFDENMDSLKPNGDSRRHRTTPQSHPSLIGHHTLPSDMHLIFIISGLIWCRYV